MFSKPDAPSTPRGADFKSPLYMTGSWMTFAGLAMIPVLALVIGIVAAVKFKTLAPLVAGVIIAVPFGVAAALMFYFTLRSTLMIYPTQPKQPKVTDGPTVVIEVVSSIRTPKGDIVKDKHAFDVGAHPSVVLDALRYMKATGTTSRDTVCKVTKLPQKPWRRLMDALMECGGVGEHGPTDEIDKIIAQVERQLRDL